MEQIKKETLDFYKKFEENRKPEDVKYSLDYFNGWDFGKSKDTNITITSTDMAVSSLSKKNLRQKSLKDKIQIKK